MYIDFYEAYWAEVNRTKFKIGCYLVVGYDAGVEMPTFVQPGNILLGNEDWELTFICEKLNTVEFFFFTIFMVSQLCTVFQSST